MQHISTKTGDEGTTALFDGKRYPKSHQIYDLLGTIDKLSSAIGVAKEKFVLDEYLSQIETIQQGLLDMGSYFASIHGEPINFSEEKLEELEKWLLEIESKLPKITEFIHPGGKNGGAELHHARSVAREAERFYWKFKEENENIDLNPGKYLNRLSDYLFQLGRLVSM